MYKNSGKCICRTEGPEVVAWFLLPRYLPKIHNAYKKYSDRALQLHPT